MKKGFTLIELIAVLFILSLILAIAVPVVNSNINASKQSAKESLLNYVAAASRIYVTDNPKDFISITEGNCNEGLLELGDLQNAKLVEKSVKDPVSNQEISVNTKIKICKNNDKYSFQLLLED